MKLLAVRLARSIWFIPQYFLNPRGLFLRPASVATKERYQFLKGPVDNGSINSNEPKYEQGAFKTASGVIQIVTMTLHADGIVVDTRSSTEDADAFLEDLASWVAKEYGLPLFSDLPIKRAYISELNITLDKPPAFFNPKLDAFFRSVSSALAPEKTPTGFLSWQFSSDPTVHPIQRNFRVDREVNTSFDSNRYYSFAALTTKQHLELLAKMEEAL
jgi:hypothetical protein